MTTKNTIATAMRILAGVSMIIASIVWIFIPFNPNDYNMSDFMFVLLTYTRIFGIPALGALGFAVMGIHKMIEKRA